MVERGVKIEDLEASSFGITVKSMVTSSDAMEDIVINSMVEMSTSHC
jgi:hypothetical protein